MITFGVIGYGYWGPNIVRNLRSLEGCQVAGICDQSPAALKRIQTAHPGVPVYSDSKELISSPDVDAIAVITPVWTHYELTKAALENALGEALQLGHNYVGTEHLLLGILLDGNSVASKVLLGLGLNQDVVRAQILKRTSSL